jgi:hypothetical protein
MTNRNENLRFTLKHLLILVALLAAALCAGRITGSPAMSIHSMLLVVGWVMYRFMHARLVGLIPCLLGLDILSIRAIDWAYLGEDFWFEGVFNVFASCLIVAGITAFFLFGSSKRPFWRWQLANALAFLAILVAWWFTIPFLGEAAVAQRRASDTAHNIAAMAKSVKQVEAVRTQLGHIPTANELAERLKEGLPHVRDDLYETEIRYLYVSDHEYRLRFIINWGDVYNYDSTQPTKGWYIEPF